MPDWFRHLAGTLRVNAYNNQNSTLLRLCDGSFVPETVRQCNYALHVALMAELMSDTARQLTFLVAYLPFSPTGHSFLPLSRGQGRKRDDLLPFHGHLSCLLQVPRLSDQVACRCVP